MPLVKMRVYWREGEPHTNVADVLIRREEAQRHTSTETKWCDESQEQCHIRNQGRRAEVMRL